MRSGSAARTGRSRCATTPVRSRTRRSRTSRPHGSRGSPWRRCSHPPTGTLDQGPRRDARCAGRGGLPALARDAGVAVRRRHARRALSRSTPSVARRWRSDDGTLTGTVDRYFDEHDKLRFVAAGVPDNGYSLQDVVAIGDSRSDLPLFRHAAASIALERHRRGPRRRPAGHRHRRPARPLADARQARRRRPARDPRHEAGGSAPTREHVGSGQDLAGADGPLEHEARCLLSCPATIGRARIDRDHRPDVAFERVERRLEDAAVRVDATDDQRVAGVYGQRRVALAS